MSFVLPRSCSRASLDDTLAAVQFSRILWYSPKSLNFRDHWFEDSFSVLFRKGLAT